MIDKHSEQNSFSQIKTTGTVVVSNAQLYTFEARKMIMWRWS